MAYDRLLQVLVKIHRADNAGRYTTAATYTFGGFHNNSAALSPQQRVCRTSLGASRVETGMADGFNKFPGNSAVRPDFYAAFLKRMTLPVHCRADKYARKAAYALCHIACF